MFDDEIVDQSQPPAYFDLLGTSDQEAFNNLREELSAPDHRYNRNKRLKTFSQMVEQIRQFCIKEDDDDWKRCLVCGICWIGNDIAINCRQLRIILGKSKSSINGAFAKMGYETLPLKGSESTVLHDTIPYLKGNFNENRQWTVRRRSAYTQIIEASLKGRGRSKVRRAKTPHEAPIVQIQPPQIQQQQHQMESNFSQAFESDQPQDMLFDDFASFSTYDDSHFSISFEADQENSFQNDDFGFF